MEYNISDFLRIDGNEGFVAGKILYRNIKDGCQWFEYLINFEDGSSGWLSVDDIYREYSISYMCGAPNMDGYHEVDRGVETVMRKEGAVDVDLGEKADFIEYEDVTEEKIISIEYWSDGTEYSTGYYLDADEIQFIRHGNMQGTSSIGKYTSSGGSYGGSSNGIKVIFMVIIAFFFLLPIISSVYNLSGSNTKISKYLEKNTARYTYVTSITGNEKQTAKVYSSSTDLETTVQDIINGIEGNTESVQTCDTDDDESVAILTNKEYCFVYTSDDGEDVLIQISSRKYTYTTDEDLYRSRRTSRRYYRRFYYSRGYTTDNSKYSKYASAYKSYNDTPVASNSSDVYQSYSNSVRQTSIASRQSDGGGTSYGK